MQPYSTNKRYQTLSEAIHIIDPMGTLAPGTPEHNRMTEEILAWMEVMEHEEVLRLSQTARRPPSFKLW